ncbi:uncharacterized protein V1510DRAFT_411741 [Dipodascopsis tothii]|uniref:uncharacterized protein n=1 Tax=Dipodascopsis tothii TaxID=44089 RepID=UPI0034CDA968
MPARRTETDKILEQRLALRAHTNSLKLQAAHSALASSNSVRAQQALAISKTSKNYKVTKVDKRRTKAEGFLDKLSATATATGFATAAVGAQSKSALKRAAIAAASTPSADSQPIKELSKSAVRRQKRKDRSHLGQTPSGQKRSMRALEAALDDIFDTAPASKDAAAPAAAPVVEAPVQQAYPFSITETTRAKPMTRKQNEKLVRSEVQRFNTVLRDREFQQSPFAALRGLIASRVGAETEDTEMK